jgi:hypothetical protein
MAFSPDQRRVLFCRANDDFTSYQIYETRRDDRGLWGAPTMPKFAGAWSNADPHIAPDGRTVFFISNRPAPGKAEPESTLDIWFARLGQDDEWGDAEPVGLPVSMPGDEWSPIVYPLQRLPLAFSHARHLGRGQRHLMAPPGRPLRDPGRSARVNTSAGSGAVDRRPMRPSDRSPPDLVPAGTASGGSTSSEPPAIKALGDHRASWATGQHARSSISTRASPPTASISLQQHAPYTGPQPRRVDSAASSAALVGIGNGKGDISFRSERSGCKAGRAAPQLAGRKRATVA